MTGGKANAAFEAQHEDQLEAPQRTGEKRIQAEIDALLDDVA